MLPIPGSQPAGRRRLGGRTIAVANGSSLVLRAAAGVIFVFLLSAVLAKIGVRLLPTVAQALPLLGAAYRLPRRCLAMVRRWAKVKRVQRDAAKQNKGSPSALR